MYLTPLQSPPFTPTEKLPGHKVLTSRRCHVIGEDGAVVPDETYNHSAPSCEAVQNEHRWLVWATCGLGMAVLLVVML